MARWIALFSQTGSEIVDIAEHLGVWPSRIYTNNANVDNYHPKIKDKVIVMTPAAIEEQLQYDSEISNTCVTLHGYLKILSPKVIDTGLEIYNGHPAYISEYPELKGKDPQEKTWDNTEKYNLIGSTVHRVNEGVDEGNVVREYIVENTCKTKEEMYKVLRKTSLESWLLFLKGKL